MYPAKPASGPNEVQMQQISLQEQLVILKADVKIHVLSSAHSLLVSLCHFISGISLQICLQKATILMLKIHVMLIYSHFPDCCEALFLSVCNTHLLKILIILINSPLLSLKLNQCFITFASFVISIKQEKTHVLQKGNKKSILRMYSSPDLLRHLNPVFKITNILSIISLVSIIIYFSGALKMSCTIHQSNQRISIRT